jgi:hypothetical protein
MLKQIKYAALDCCWMSAIVLLGALMTLIL